MKYSVSPLTCGRCVGRITEALQRITDYQTPIKPDRKPISPDPIFRFPQSDSNRINRIIGFRISDYQTPIKPISPDTIFRFSLHS